MEEEPSEPQRPRVVMRSEPYPTPTEGLPSAAEVLAGPRVSSEEGGEEEEEESHVSSVVEKCSGVVAEALREGRGVLCVAVGPDGAPHGRGVRLHPNGNFLEGHFESLDHIREARISTPSPGYYMKGAVVQGVMDGDVEIALPAVGRFVGTLARGKPHGMGVWVRADGTWYEGTWDDGERHGTGTEHYSEHMSYTGGWSRDLYDGPGELRSFDSRFRGTWRRGTRVGAGTLVEDHTVAQSFQVEYDDDGNEVSRVTAEAAEIQRLRREVEALRREAAAATTEAGPATTTTPPPPKREEEGAATYASLCKVCFVQPISRVLRPCNHACLCMGCEDKLRRTQDQTTVQARFGRIRCPICRSTARVCEDIILA